MHIGLICIPFCLSVRPSLDNNSYLREYYRYESKYPFLLVFLTAMSHFGFIVSEPGLLSDLSVDIESWDGIS